MFLIGSALCAQMPPVPTLKPIKSFYTADELRQDIDQLQALLERYHPNYGLIESPEALNHRFEAVRKGIKDKHYTLHQAFMLLKPLVTQVNDGHTCLSMSPLQQIEYIQKLRSPRATFDYIGDSLFVRADGEALSSARKVNKINGLSIPNLRVALGDFVCRDHQGDSLALAANSYVLNFYLAQLFHERNKPYEIDILSATGKSTGLEFKSEPFSTQMIRRSLEEKKKKYFLYWKDSLPILSIDSFVHDEQEFEQFLDKSFSEIKASAAKDLVIDLRKNSGGILRSASVLLAYLLDRKHHFPKYVHITGNEVQEGDSIIPANTSFLGYAGMQKNKMSARYIKQRLNKNLRQVANWPYKRAVKPRGLVVPTKPISWGKDEFDGNIHVLISEHTFSAASQFARQLRLYNRRAIFYGQPTGGSGGRSCMSSELSFVLKNTRFEASIPFICEMQDLEPDRSFFLPDIFVLDNFAARLAKLDLGLRAINKNITGNLFMLVPKLKPAPNFSKANSS